jgi:hypothetical protein
VLLVVGEVEVQERALVLTADLQLAVHVPDEELVGLDDESSDVPRNAEQLNAERRTPMGVESTVTGHRGVQLSNGRESGLYLRTWNRQQEKVVSVGAFWTAVSFP